MTSFIDLCRAELFKLTHRRMTWILTALIVGIIALIYIVLAAAVAGTTAADTDAQTITNLKELIDVSSVPAFGDDIVWQIVGIMGIILVSSSIGNEFSWRTVITMLTWSGDRLRFLLAKLSVTAALVALGVVLGFVVAFVSSIVADALVGDFTTNEISGALVVDTLLAAAGTYVALMPYVLLGAALSLFGKQAALGIGVALAVLFLEGLAITLVDLAGESFGWVKNLSMNWNVQGLLAANGTVEGLTGAPDANLPSAPLSILVLLIYIAGYISAMLLVFNRRDITE